MSSQAKHYNDIINSQLDHNVEKFIEHMPQPTMLYTPPMTETPVKKKVTMRGGGSKGGQRFVLTSGALPYDYPSTLAVGSAKKPTSMAKEFYGEPELVNQPYSYGDPSPSLVGGRIGRGYHKYVKEGPRMDGDVYSGGSLLRAEMPLGYDTHYPMGGNHLDGCGFFDSIKSGFKKIIDDPRVRELADKALEAGIKKGVEMGNQQLSGMGLSGGYHCSLEGCGFFDSIKGAVKKITDDPRVKELANNAFKKGLEVGKDYISKNMQSPESGAGFFDSLKKGFKKITDDPRIRELADKALETAIQKGTEYGNQQLKGMGRMTKAKFHSLPPHLQEQVYHHHAIRGGKMPKWLSDVGKFFGKIGKKVVDDPRVRDLADNALETAIKKGTEYGNQQLAGMGMMRPAVFREYKEYDNPNMRTKLPRITKEQFATLPPHIQEKVYHHHAIRGGKMPKWLSDVGKFFGRIGKKVVDDPRVRDLADNALETAIKKGTEYGNQQLAGMGISGGNVGDFFESVFKPRRNRRGRKNKSRAPEPTPTPAPTPELTASGRRRRGGSILEDSMPYSHAILPSSLRKPPFRGRSRIARGMAAPLTAYSQSSAIYGAGRSGGSARGAMISKLMREKGISLGEASRYIKQNGLM